MADEGAHSGVTVGGWVLYKHDDHTNDVAADGGSLYFGFITALSVGYADGHPSAGNSKLIALFGLIRTGIMIAVAGEVGRTTFDAQAAGAVGGR